MFKALLLAPRPYEYTMPWLQLRINTNRELAHRVEFAMSRLNAQAITLEDNADQPIFEPEIGETPLWQETRVVGLFEATIDTSAADCLLKELLAEHYSNHHWHLLEDKDWEREWMQHYHPIKCAENLWICPSWISPPDPDAVNLLLDPGLAFGTGTHPTTFLCLQWLAKQNLSAKVALDYGCGSGILGIAALLLGADSAVGIDIDPQALLATQENVARNNLPKTRFPVHFPDSSPDIQVDIVMANILAGPLVDLAPNITAHMKTGAKLCLSGVIETQKEDLIKTYRKWVDINEITQKEEWICITGTRR